MRIATWMCTLIALLAGGDVFAQGFDWEWTPRSPKQMPNTFVGIEVISGAGFHMGELQYLEDLTGFQCCTFTNGTGTPLRISLSAEKWVAPSIAVILNAGVTSMTANFAQLSNPVPISDGRELQTEYHFDNSLMYVTMSIGTRVKLFATHLSVGGTIRAHFNLAKSAKLTESVVSPSDFFFDTNPPTKDYEWVPIARLADIAKVIVEPAVFIAYDIPVAAGMFLQPMILLSTQLNSVSTVYPWRFVDIGVGLRLMKGFDLGI
ncbi:MAG: hypothetical protein HQ472_07305 [Ignavibacteria bacterium]|nr:hypothetical protein [Ignavibacteria bacterium]